MVVRSVEEVKKKFKPISVIETEDSFWVLKDKDKGYFRVLKPRPLKQVQDILSEGLFPSRYVKLLENLTETKALSVARKIKKDLLLWGPAGTGKTTACVWKIAKLVQNHKVHSPLYIGFDFNYEKINKLKEEADCFLIDDFNTKILSPARLNLLIEIVYHAHAREKRLFITTNEKELSVPEPVLSRILEMCKVVKIEGGDLRVKFK